MKELSDYHRELDMLDAQLCALIVRRLEVSEDMARFKLAHRQAPELDDRERSLLYRAKKLSAKYGDDVAQIYRTILSACRKRQAAHQNDLSGDDLSGEEL